MKTSLRCLHCRFKNEAVLQNMFTRISADHELQIARRVSLSRGMTSLDSERPSLMRRMKLRTDIRSLLCRASTYQAEDFLRVVAYGEQEQGV